MVHEDKDGASHQVIVKYRYRNKNTDCFTIHAVREFIIIGNELVTN